MGDDIERRRSSGCRELIYTSRATQPFSHEQLVELLDQARAKNEARDITGMLVHADGVFLQILEGPHEEIGHLMKSIRADRRHGAIRLVSDRGVAHRGFGDWTMAFRDAPQEHLVAFDPSFDGDGSIARVGSGLARRLLTTFLVLHD